MQLIGEKLLDVTPKTEINGCGAKGWGWIIPDRLFLVDFSNACNIHDCYYYWIKRNKKERNIDLPADIYWLKNLPLASQQKIADNVFSANLHQINKKKSPTKLGYYARLPLIKLYYQSVRKCGSIILNS